MDPSHAATAAVASTAAATAAMTSAALPGTGGESGSGAIVQDASLEMPATATTPAPEPGAEIPAVTIEPPVPATMSADISKRRRLAADPGAHKCLTTAIYFEARGEPKRGQTAVAQVILNRASTKGFPKSVCEVVYQGAKRKTGCQFSFTCDKVPDKIREPKAWKKAEEIAQDVLTGKTLLPELVKATHYHASYVSPRWAPKMKKLAKIGVHIFYDA